jgi:hypothetical protein
MGGGFGGGHMGGGIGGGHIGGGFADSHMGSIGGAAAGAFGSASASMNAAVRWEASVTNAAPSLLLTGCVTGPSSAAASADTTTRAGTGSPRRPDGFANIRTTTEG